MINEMREFVLELVQSEYETSNQLVETKDEFEQLCADEGVRCTNAMWDLYQKYHMEGLDEPATEEFDEIIEEALSNKEKLKRAYPELNFENSINETLTEAVDAEDKLQIAVGILYDMDNFTLSVRDNGYWLSMGVPDGEFSEDDRDLAEANYEEHQWLIEADDGNFDAEAFKDLLDAFETATDDGDYDQNERAKIIHEAEVILNMNESVLDMDRRCEECNTLLNDMGKCPKCDDGEEEKLDEATLNEGPIENKMNRIQRKIDKDRVKKAANLQTLFKKTLSKDNKYYVDEKILNYNEFSSLLSKVASELNTDILTLSPEHPKYDDIKSILNSVAIDKNGWIIRRGLELIKPGRTAYRADRADLLEIKNGFRAEDIIGSDISTNSKTEPDADSSKPSATSNTSGESESENGETDGNNSDSSSEPSDATGGKSDSNNPDWVTNTSIQAAITLRSKRKDGSAVYYDANGDLFDYRDITVDNMHDVFLDKEAKIPFMKLMEETKKNYARRKKAIERTAAVFGESYDDNLAYDINEMEELDEAITSKEAQELMHLAKEIGLKTGVDIADFAKREVNDGESILDALRRYRDDLGDDFELIDEQFSENVLEEEFTNYSQIRDNFEKNHINYSQREVFESMLVKGCAALNVDPELALIYEDSDREFDPIYFADDAKELQYNVLKLQVFDINVVRIEFKGTIYIVFSKQADADIYMTYAH